MTAVARETSSVVYQKRQLRELSLSCRSTLAVTLRSEFRPVVALRTGLGTRHDNCAADAETIEKDARLCWGVCP